MSDIIVFGDLVQAELIRFLKYEKDYEGRTLIPMVLSLDPKIIKLRDIDLDKFGVDQWGNEKKGGMFYKAYTYPNYISSAFYFGDARVYIVATGLKFEDTPLTQMFFQLKMENDKFRDERISFLATIANNKQELDKLRNDTYAWMKKYADLRAMVSGNSQPDNSEEGIDKSPEDA